MSSETSNQSELNVVTGAFGYTGKYIALWLLADGIRVKPSPATPCKRIVRSAAIGSSIDANFGNSQSM